MAKVAKAIVGVALVGLSFVLPGSAVFLGRLASIGYALIVSNALDVVAQSLAGKPRSRRLGIDIEYSGTVEPRRLIYGRQKVSGMNVIPPWTSGDKNQYLHQVLVLTGHRVQAIQSVYFGQTEITSIGSIPGNKNDGKVSSGPYAGKTWIRRYLGGTTQTVDYILNAAFPTQWDENHRLLGNAYVALQYEVDEDVYQTGKPEVTVIIQGRRAYDPRLDIDPGTNVTTAAYIAYTTNPALCVADYLLNYLRGRGVDKSRIDWESVMVAANICDESVAIPNSETQSRYTCNVTLEMAETDEQDRENLKALVGAMMGHAVYRSGKWRIHAGAAAAEASFELGDDDQIGKWSYRTAVPADEDYNYVRGQFVDPDRGFQLSEFEPRSSSAYETADGGQFQREIILPACTDAYEAQRDATIVLKRSRLRKQLTATWKVKAFKIRPWDVGTVTFTPIGWISQQVRCIAWSFNQNGTINATFLEEDDAVWDDPDPSDYTIPAIGVANAPNPGIPNPVAGFTALGVADGIWINIDYPTGWQPTLDYFRVYGYTSATPFSSASVLVAQSKTDRIWIPRTTTDPVYLWVTVVRRPGNSPIEGEEMPQGDGVQAAATSISSGFRVTVDRATHLKVLVETSGGTTVNTSTITAIDEVGAPTYSWARTSGSTKISVVASTAATTGFSASGLANNEQVQATFRCTVTSAGASPGTATVDVVVTFRRDDALFD